MDRSLMVALGFAGVTLMLVLSAEPAMAQQTCSARCPNGSMSETFACNSNYIPLCQRRSPGGSPGAAPNTTRRLDAEDRALINSRERAKDHRRANELNDLGIAANKAGDYAKAVSYYEQAAKLWPQDRTIATNLAGARKRLAEQAASAANAKVAGKAAGEFAKEQRRTKAPAPAKGLTFMTGPQTGVQLNPGVNSAAARELPPASPASLAGANSAREQLLNATSGKQSVDATFENASTRVDNSSPLGVVKVPLPNPSDPVIPAAFAANPEIVKAVERREASRKRIDVLKKERVALDLSKPANQVLAAELEKQEDTEQGKVNFENFSVADIIARGGAADKK